MSGKNPDGGVIAAGLPISEASEAVGLSKITVLRRVKSGAWPGGRSGRKWLVSNEFVQAVSAEIRSGRQFVIEDFAAKWMTRDSAPEPTPEAVA